MYRALLGCVLRLGGALNVDIYINSEILVELLLVVLFTVDVLGRMQLWDPVVIYPVSR